MTSLSDSMQKLLATRGLGPSASTKAEASPAIDISGMDEMSLSMRKLLPVHLRAAYDQNWSRSTLAHGAADPLFAAVELELSR
jgi:hypothetical protein